MDFWSRNCSTSLGQFGPLGGPGSPDTRSRHFCSTIIYTNAIPYIFAAASAYAGPKKQRPSCAAIMWERRRGFASCYVTFFFVYLYIDNSQFCLWFHVSFSIMLMIPNSKLSGGQLNRNSVKTQKKEGKHLHKNDRPLTSQNYFQSRHETLHWQELCCNIDGGKSDFTAVSCPHL